MKHNMLRAIFLIFIFNSEFVCSVDKHRPPQWYRDDLWTGNGAENIKHKFRFAPKLSSIYINQKCSMRVSKVFKNSLFIEY